MKFCGLKWLLVIPLLLLVKWGQVGTPGWPNLRGDAGKIFVKLGESLVIDNVRYYGICRLWVSGRII